MALITVNVVQYGIFAFSDQYWRSSSPFFVNGNVPSKTSVLKTPKRNLRKVKKKNNNNNIHIIIRIMENNNRKLQQY